MIKVYCNGQLFWDRISVADTPFRRFMGLMGKKFLADGEGMLIVPCNQVHTFHMHFPLKVFYISKDMRVLAVQTMEPWKIGSRIKKAEFVLEMPANSPKKRNVNVGDFISIG